MLANQIAKLPSRHAALALNITSHASVNEVRDTYHESFLLAATGQCGDGGQCACGAWALGRTSRHNHGHNRLILT
jgi:hypothetical protein